MAEITLTVQEKDANGEIDVAGNLVALASGNNYYLPNGAQDAQLAIRGTGTQTLTMVTDYTDQNEPLGDKTISVTASTDVEFPFFGKSAFNKTSNNVLMTVAGAGVSVVAFKR